MQRPSQPRQQSKQDHQQDHSQHHQQDKSTTNSSTPADQEAERRKIMETLGLFQDKNDQNVTVNFYEQGNFGRLERLSNRDAFEQSFADPGGVLDTRMNELETQLEQAKELVNALTGMAKELRDNEIEMEKEEKEEEKEKQKEKEKSNDSLTLTDDPEHLEAGQMSFRSYQLPLTGWRVLPAHTIVRFNKVLDRAYHQHITGGVRKQTINRLWGIYSRIRYMMVSRWHDMPKATWVLLWIVFSAETEANPNRMSHIYLLFKDMQAAGINLNDDQQLLAIEAMFIDGWKEEALKNHRIFAGTLGTKNETFMKYWQLGLRMYCLVGDLDRAQRIVDTIDNAPYPHEKDPRFLLPFIRACAADPAWVQRGFEAYRELRDMLGAEMTKVD